MHATPRALTTHIHIRTPVQGWPSLRHYGFHTHSCRVFRCSQVLVCICFPMCEPQQVPALFWGDGYTTQGSSVLQTRGDCTSRHSFSGPVYSLTKRTAKAHFPTGSWTDIKNIYTCISTIYHTALIKSGFFRVANASALFESVPLFLTHRSVRE